MGNHEAVSAICEDLETFAKADGYLRTASIWMESCQLMRVMIDEPGCHGRGLACLLQVFSTLSLSLLIDVTFHPYEQLCSFNFLTKSC